MDSSPVSHDRLVWSRRDIERRFGFSGSRYTRVGSVLPAVFAIAVTVAFFGAMFGIGSNPWSDMFIERGWTPFVIVFFALWSVMILFLKRSKLRLQRRSLRLSVIPDEVNFQLSQSTVDQVLQRLYEVSDDPKHFVLLHRIEVGLSSMRNLSHVGGVGEILRTQSEHDESVMETSFNLIRGLVWAIPILGFIGTVSGLSLAIGGFGRVLSQTDDPSKLIDALKGVTGGLATAFETTLLALIAALLVQMAMTFQKKREEEFLDECTEYCQREISRRLRTSEQANGGVAIRQSSAWRVPSTPSEPSPTDPTAGTATRPQPQPAHAQETKPKTTSRKKSKSKQAAVAAVVAPAVETLANEPTALPKPATPVAAPEALPVDDLAEPQVDAIVVEALPVEALPVEALPVDALPVDALPVDEELAEVIEVVPEVDSESGASGNPIDLGADWD